MAVLAGDVAGFARLMQQGEEETVARLEHLMADVVAPAIGDGGGRIIKHTGDGFLATFDDPLAATEAALGIQQTQLRDALADGAPPMLLRLGLTLTDAIVTPTDIFGDGVNLAARLQASAEPGGLVVSEKVAALLRAAGRGPLSDLGQIAPKHMAPVRAFAVPPPQGTPVLPRAAGVAPDGRPSIAILPFRDLGGTAAEGTWFAEGITEGIIHVLTGVEPLLLISRASAAAVAGRSADARQAGLDLGVRYVLSGVVHRRGERLRITTELMEPESGTVIRTGRYDGPLGDVFEIQDSIAAQLVGAILPAVRDQELRVAMRKPPDSLTAYDRLLQALDVLYRLEPASFDRARGLLQQAIALDPGFAPAYSHAATWYTFRIAQGWSEDPAADAAEASRNAEAALARDPGDAVALAVHGQMLTFVRRDYAGAKYVLERAVAAGPRFAGNAGVERILQGMHALRLRSREQPAGDDAPAVG